MEKADLVTWLWVSILTVLALFSTDVAAVPEVVQYQGDLTDSGGRPFGPRFNHRSRLKPQLCIAGRVLNLPFDHGGYQW